MEKTTFIYALCEPGTRTVRYIGKANDPKRRLKEHLRKSRISDTYLGRWLKTLGDDRPSLLVLREVPIDQWEIAEERYIRLATGLGMRLTNSTEGGEGVTMTPETIGKISRTMTGQLKSEQHKAAIAAGKLGEKNPCFGKVYSEEERRVLSENQKGPKNHNFGVSLSAEQKARISATLTGRTQSIETKAKRSASLRAFYEAKRGAAQL